MRALPASSLKPVVSSAFFIFLFVLFAVIFTATFLWVPAAAQQSASAALPAPRPLITQALDESRMKVLKGNTHPLARREFDLGTAPATLPMERMLLVLKRSPEQESALRKLLDDQQDKNSPHYHKWLTPEQFGAQFGPSDADMQTITSWLQSHGFQVGTTKGRTVLEFSGSASQVQEAFHTPIHKYIVNGEQRWANASDPSIPAALAPAVAGIDSLHNFGRKRMSHFVGVARREKATGKITISQREFTFPVSNNGCNAQDNNCYVVGPYDFATIYGVVPLWINGIDGTGQHIGIVQDSNINVADVHAFRAMFNLPSNDPNVIVDGADPGILNAGQFGGETEADLDVEWSGAVAKGATIDLVVSADTDTTAGIDLSAKSIIETNNDAIMSVSFGECEAFLGTSGNQFFNALWEQAASQGISVFISAGDEGSASCDRFQGLAPQPAADGLAVSGIASTPFNVAVGGTDFQDVFNPTTYWNITNDINQASAIGYIPETVWNDSCTNALFANVQGGNGSPEVNCNNTNLSSFVAAIGGSGGASNCSNSTSDGISITCISGYPKPTWQTGNGVPSDGVRDLPDVSLFASDGFEGNFYIFCQGDITPAGSCDLNAPYADFGGVGGTSASAPALAGIMALVNQTTNSRQGNPNYVFYKLASQVPSAFHDVTAGTNRVPCQAASLDCTTTVASDSIGIINGYDAGSGYDLATGLGSVNANTLVTNWNSVVFTPTTTTLVLNNGNPINNMMHGSLIPVQVNVTPTTGTGTIHGDVSLIDVETNQSITVISLADGLLPVSTGTNQLPGGTTYHVIAHYSGDGTFAPSDSAASSVLSITPEPSTTTVTVAGFDASGFPTASPFPFGTAVFVHATVVGQTGTGFPTGMVTFSDTGTLPKQISGLTPPIANPVPLNSAGTTTIGAGIINFDAGNHSISASYAGDNSFLLSTSTTPTTFTISPGFVAVSGPSNVTISSPGASGSTTIGIIASTNFGPVSFSCAGLPAEATCTSSPVTGSGPNTVVNGTITVTTTAAHTTMRQSNYRSYYVAAMMTGLPLCGIFLLATPKRRRGSMVLGLIVLSLLLFFPACGGGGGSSQHTQDPGTPVGSYAITLTATGGSLSAQGTFTLTVQ